MTRAYEIAAALREFSFWAEYGEDAAEQEKMTADLYAAADLIENQQRHIEALMKANAGLRDTIMRRDKQIEDMKQGMAQLAKAVAVEEVELIEWKEVSREEEPTLYKALEGIPGAEDTTLMRGTLRVLRKERG